MDWGNWGVQSFVGGGFGGGNPMPPIYDASLVFNAPASAPKDRGKVFTDIAGIGADITKTILGYKLQSKQIDKGQFPTIGYDENGRPSPKTDTTFAASGAAIGSAGPGGWVVWAVLAVVAILLFRRK